MGYVKPICTLNTITSVEGVVSTRQPQYGALTNSRFLAPLPPHGEGAHAPCQLPYDKNLLFSVVPGG